MAYYDFENLYATFEEMGFLRILILKIDQNETRLPCEHNKITLIIS